MRDLLSANAPLLEDLLSKKLNDELIAIASRHRYDDGQLIHSRGTLKPGISIVRQGAVRVGNVGRDGSYLATSQLDTGQCFGEHTVFAGLPRTHDINAVGDTMLDEISKLKLLRLVQAEPQLAQALLTISLIRTHGLLEFMDDLRRLPLEVRVAKFIFGASTVSDELAVRQEELSFTFGVSRVSMGKVLKRLERQGLLKLGYGRIEVADAQGLSDWLEHRMLVTPLSMPVFA